MATTRNNEHFIHHDEEPLRKRSRLNEKIENNDVCIDLKRLMAYNNEITSTNTLSTNTTGEDGGDSGFQDFTSNDSPLSNKSSNDDTNNSIKQTTFTTNDSFTSINQLKESNNELKDSDEFLNNQSSEKFNQKQQLNNDEDDNESIISDISCLSSLSAELNELEDTEKWQSNFGPISWVQEQITSGSNPRQIIDDLLPNNLIPEKVDNLTLWKFIVNLLSEPPKRKKLTDINNLDDVVSLIKNSKKIVVLTGAGISVSSGIPDFRSRDGIYARLSVDFPDLPDPQAMFDINYFRRDQRPFYKFAKEIYPGQFKPSLSHKFIKLIEQNGKLLRNYTQNIDTLEQAVNIERLITCHGSFSTASCTNCKYKVDGSFIKDDIFAQRIPKCPRCPSDCEELAVLKPDIVFFGEGLPEIFHDSMTADKEECDLLIVIGSSLKVKPVALIPTSIPADVPQILINREHLSHMTFDVELLGDCDVIIQELCHRLGDSWKEICVNGKLKEINNIEELHDNKLKSNTPSSSQEGSINLKSNDIEKLKECVNNLPEDSFIHIKPSRYLFKGAEVYSSSDSGSSCDDEDDSDDDDDFQDLIRNDDSNSNLSTSQNTNQQILINNQAESNKNDTELDKPNTKLNSLSSVDTNNN